MDSMSFRKIEMKVCESSVKYPTTISSQWDAVEFLRSAYGNELVESFSVIMLDARNRPIGWSEVSRGTQTASLAHPREVFMPAVHTGAVSMIISHNHPSGDSTPSPEDKQVTKRMANAAKVMGISVIDHIIIASDESFSFRESCPEMLLSDLDV